MDARSWDVSVVSRMAPLRTLSQNVRIHEPVCRRSLDGTQGEIRSSDGSQEVMANAATTEFAVCGVADPLAGHQPHSLDKIRHPHLDVAKVLEVFNVSEMLFHA